MSKKLQQVGIQFDIYSYRLITLTGNGPGRFVELQK